MSKEKLMKKFSARLDSNDISESGKRLMMRVYSNHLDTREQKCEYHDGSCTSCDLGYYGQCIY